MAPLGSGRFGFTLAGGAAYAGTDVSADLLWHMQNLSYASSGSAVDITTSNGYESNGINVGGNTIAAKFTGYDSTQTLGSTEFSHTHDALCIVRVDGDLTISSGATVTSGNSTDACLGLYLYVDGNLTVDGRLSTYARGQQYSSAVSVPVNSTENKVAGSTVITMSGGASGNTAGSNTTTAMTAGGGGTGTASSNNGSGGAGGSAHTFSGGSGGGAGGRVGYPQHYQGGQTGGSAAASNAGAGGAGGASGYTYWGYWTQDWGGNGGTGNPGGAGGA